MRYTIIASSIVALIQAPTILGGVIPHGPGARSRLAKRVRQVTNIELNYDHSIFPVESSTLVIGGDLESNEGVPGMGPLSETESSLIRYLIPNAINELDFTRDGHQGNTQLLTIQTPRAMAQMWEQHPNDPAAAAGMFREVRRNLVLRTDLDVRAGAPFGELGGPGTRQDLTVLVQPSPRTGRLPVGYSLSQVFNDAIELGRTFFQIWLTRPSTTGRRDFSRFSVLRFWIGINNDPVDLLAHNPLPPRIQPPQPQTLPTLEDGWCPGNGCADMAVNWFSDGSGSP